jgi:hypothetical protein
MHARRSMSTEETRTERDALQCPCMSSRDDHKPGKGTLDWFWPCHRWFSPCRGGHGLGSLQAAALQVLGLSFLGVSFGCKEGVWSASE